MPTITLSPDFHAGDRLSPSALHQLIDGANVSGFSPADIGISSSGFSIGNTRPSLALGLAHFDTTTGIDGLYFAFLSASNHSVSGWLAATPRRECYCWANSSVSLGTPVFIGTPGAFVAEYTRFDGQIFPNIYMFTGASGPDAAFFVTLESASANKPVKCMWAGMIPPTLSLLNASSGASLASPLFSDYAAPAQLKAGTPTARNLTFGVNLGNQPGVLWGGGPSIERIS